MSNKDTGFPSLVGDESIVPLASKIRDSVMSCVMPVVRDLLAFDLDCIAERTGLDFDLVGKVYFATIQPMVDEFEFLAGQSSADWWIENRETAHLPFQRIADAVRASIPVVLDNLETEAKAGLAERRVQ